MNDDGERRGFHVYLTVEAHDGWVKASEDHNVSMTALAEVLGLWFAGQCGLPPELPPDALKRAAAVDAKRRRRRRDGGTN